MDATRLNAVRREVEQFTAGSFLDGAAIIPVSTVTQNGIAELREALRPLAAACASRDTSRHFRLPIDRCFTMRGFGTGGHRHRGRRHHQRGAGGGSPPPAARDCACAASRRHGRAVKRAAAGQRAALNVAGADPNELVRGQVLAEPGRFVSTCDIGCTLHLLPSAGPLKHGAPVHFHAGTAEVEGRVRLITSLDPMLPGATANVCIRLESPLLLLPGDRFILRRFSPVTTIGGWHRARLRPSAPAAYRHGLAAWPPWPQPIPPAAPLCCWPTRPTA